MDDRPHCHKCFDLGTPVDIFAEPEYGVVDTSQFCDCKFGKRLEWGFKEGLRWKMIQAGPRIKKRIEELKAEIAQKPLYTVIDEMRCGKCGSVVSTLIQEPCRVCALKAEIAWLRAPLIESLSGEPDQPGIDTSDLGFWQSKPLEQLIEEQGVKPIKTWEEGKAPCPAFGEDFDRWLREERRQSRTHQTPAALAPRPYRRRRRVRHRRPGCRAEPTGDSPAPGPGTGKSCS